MQPLYRYSGIVTKVIDGDTLDITIDLGFNIYTKERFRLFGIDTPEKTSKLPEIRAIANQATAFVKETVEGKEVTIESVEKDKYGRWLAKVHINPDQPTLNEQLIALGLAKVYFGDSKLNLGWG